MANKNTRRIFGRKVAFCPISAVFPEKEKKRRKMSDWRVFEYGEIGAFMTIKTYGEWL